MKVSLIFLLLLATSTSAHVPVTSELCAKYPDWGPCITFLKNQKEQDEVISHLKAETSTIESRNHEKQFDKIHTELQEYENSHPLERHSWTYWESLKKGDKLQK